MAEGEVLRSIHPYRLKVEGPSAINLEEIFKKFSQKNIKENILDIDGEEYLLVSFEKRDSLFAGFFVKIKDTSQVIVERSKSLLHFFKFLEDQDPGEASNFIWDLQENIVIGEYNHSGARYLSQKLDKYLSKSLNRPISASVIPTEESYKDIFLKNKILKSVSLKIPRPHVNIFEEAMGLDVKGIDKYTKEDEDLNITLTIACVKKPHCGLLREKIISLYKKILGHKEVEKLGMSVRDGKGNNIQLLDEVLIKEKISFEIDQKTKTINREDFFKKVRAYWEGHKKEIIKTVQNGADLVERK